MEKIRVGLLGLGVVGSGVVKTIRSQEKKLAERLGKQVEIVKILVRDPEKERSAEVEQDLLTTSFAEVLASRVDVIVEVIGGVDPTLDYVKHAISQGCHVVTANKELLAKHGEELTRLANEHRVHLAYEASVAGGIPILSVLRQFLRTNEITSVQGIVNGTTNYILTEMEKRQVGYQEVLAEAQRLGFAEADPTADVEGYDATYKLFILSQLVFGEAKAWEEIERKGISRLRPCELHFAKQLGYRVKLLAQAKKTAAGIRMSVRPTLLAQDHPLARMDGAFNGVQVTGNIVGDLLFTGRGAGELPTASAVVEDLAYLLTQPFTPQPQWRIRSEQHDWEAFFAQEDTWYVYLEAAQPDYDPYRLLQALLDAGIQVKKLHTEYHQHDVLRCGVIVQAFSREQLERLAGSIAETVSIMPVLLTQDEQSLESAELQAEAKGFALEKAGGMKRIG